MSGGGWLGGGGAVGSGSGWVLDGRWASSQGGRRRPHWLDVSMKSRSRLVVAIVCSRPSLEVLAGLVATAGRNLLSCFESDDDDDDDDGDDDDDDDDDDD